jgi:hypothetical protein
MKSSTVKLFWILVVIASSTFLPAVTLDQQGVCAQDSPNTTNATVLSGNDVSSQSGLQNQSISYFDGSSGYLVSPDTNNETGTSAPQKLPAVVMIHECWGLNNHLK